MAAASEAPARVWRSQSEFVYDACSGSVTSETALANPYNKAITFTYGFFNWPHLNDTITDQHFAQRDRMGRTLAFLARQIQDGQATTALAIAVNEVTSVVVDKNGLATVGGDGPAVLHPRRSCAGGVPAKDAAYLFGLQDLACHRGRHVRLAHAPNERLLHGQRHRRRAERQPLLTPRSGDLVIW